MKKCARCKLEKDVDEFGINKALSDGRNVYCRACIRKRNVDWRAFRKTKTARKQAEIVKLPVTERVETAITLGYGTWRKLQRITQLTEDEIGIVLVDLMFEKRSVRAKVIDGQRVYVRVAA